MSKTWPFKDPNEVLDYQVEWVSRLLNENILTSVWTITGSDAALLQGSTSIDGTKTIVWLSGGTLNVTYSLTNRITTDGLRTMDQTVRLKIKEK